MARLLLSVALDPLQPALLIFNRHCSTDLRDAIHDTTAQLDHAGGAGEIVTHSR
jgi:hypothetical protein